MRCALNRHGVHATVDIRRAAHGRGPLALVWVGDDRAVIDRRQHCCLHPAYSLTWVFISERLSPIDYPDCGYRNMTILFPVSVAFQLLHWDLCNSQPHNVT